MASQVFAIVLWIDDPIVTGSVMALSKVKSLDATKTSADFCEGDLVMAPCTGFPGKHRCVLAKIGSGAEAEKKELLGLITSAAFLEMVDTYATRHRAQTTSDVNDTDVPNEIATEAPAPKQSATKKRATETVTRTETDAQKKKRQKGLDAAAAELELTELSAVIDNASSVTVANLDRSDSSEPVQPVRPVSVPISSLVRDSLEVALPLVNSFENRSEVDDAGHYNLRLCSNESKIRQLENTVSNLWSWMRQIQQEVYFNQQQQGQGLQQQGLQQQGLQQQGQQQQGQQQQQHIEELPASPQNILESPSNDDHAEDRVVGGFTMDQLECKVQHLTHSSSKVATLLFRLLFKEEEFVGKTLTGARGTQAVDQDKLAVIYNITQKKFPGTTIGQIRHSLCDLLKPSRIRKQKNMA